VPVPAYALGDSIGAGTLVGGSRSSPVYGSPRSRRWLALRPRAGWPPT